MRKRPSPEEQPSLFDALDARRSSAETVRRTRPAPSDRLNTRTWRMPVHSGRTVAEIRVRWTKRLTPAQVSRVEVELSRLPRLLTKLGYGSVQVEHAFVRRRKT